MSSPLRTPLSAVMMLGGAVIGISAIVAWVVMRVTGALEGAGPILILAAIGGLCLEVSGAWVHDLQHRRRGERPHAMWGQGDRNRPK